jgi:hypothetical protein
VDEIERGLRRIASQIVEQPTFQIYESPNLAPAAVEAKTWLTPEVPKDYDGKPLRQIPVYKQLGEGAFGTVSKAVDLATGKIWAVKECKKEDKTATEDWKVEFKHEVEKLAQLQHVSFIPCCSLHLHGLFCVWRLTNMGSNRNRSSI